MLFLAAVVTFDATPADAAFFAIEKQYAAALEAKDARAVMCIQAKVTLSRKLITDYNSRELTADQERAVERDLRQLQTSAQRCPSPRAEALR